VAGSILLFFYKKERKQNKKSNKILPATSACCGAVVKNECRDHFSFNIVKLVVQCTHPVLAKLLDMTWDFVKKVNGSGI
jgi:hypothetical protein